MFIEQNKNDRTWCVGHKKPGNVELFYSVSAKKAKRGSKLTIKSHGTKIDLDGRHILLLKKILKIGTKAKSWSIEQPKSKVNN